MAKNCEVCGRTFDALYPKTTFDGHEVCKVCKTRLQNSREPFEKVREDIKSEIEKCNDFSDYSKILESAKDFPSTTGYGFDGYKITDYLGIASGETVLGTGFINDFTSGLSDFYGVEHLGISSNIHKAKEIALAKLIENCKTLGADAVIGVSFDLTSMNYMIIASATGTAVKREEL